MRLGPVSAATFAVSVLVVAAVGIGGDFPLSDDWSYAHAARSLCEHGRLDLLPWTGASLVLQAAYGALLCKLAGFSFPVLRASTVVIGVLGVVGFSFFAREAGARGRMLALAVAVFGLCPLYLSLAFSFMTDVPSIATMVWAAFAYARAIRTGRMQWVAVGSLACAASVLIRQQAVFVAGAAALALCMRPGVAPRRRLTDAAAALALPAIALAGHFAWLVLGDGVPPAVQNRLAEAAAPRLPALADVTFRGFVTLALLLLPLAVVAFDAARREARRVLIGTAIVLGGAAAVVYARNGDAMFYLTNVLYDLGVGATTLRDTLFLGHEPPLHAGAWLALPLTIAAVASGAVLAAIIALACRDAAARADAVRAFTLLAFGATFVASVWLQGHLFLDRHLLAALPFAVALVAATVREASRPRLGWACVALLAWWSVAGTHDYLEWNRVRFAMLDALEAEGVDSRSIDGGVEYNGWKLARELGTWPSMEEARTGQPAGRRSWWWVVDDTYVVTFRPLEGYAQRAQGTYQRWLIPGRGRVLLLQRDAPSPK